LEELGITLNEKTQAYLQRFGEDLKALGTQLNTQEQILKNHYMVIAENTKALVSFTEEAYGSKSEAYSDYVNNLLTGERYEAILKEEKDKLGESNLTDS
jgi:flagellum-specific peptidoglycan hydrolase FlgJ